MLRRYLWYDIKILVSRPLEIKERERLTKVDYGKFLLLPMGILGHHELLLGASNSLAGPSQTVTLLMSAPYGGDQLFTTSLDRPCLFSLSIHF